MSNVRAALILYLVGALSGVLGMVAVNERVRAPRERQRDREYSELVGRNADLIDIVTGTVTDVEGRLSAVKAELRSDATSLRIVAQRLRTIADNVDEMENSVRNLRSAINSVPSNSNN